MIWWEDWGEYADNLKAMQERGQTVKALDNRPVLDHIQSLIADCVTDCQHEAHRFRKWCKRNRIDPDLIIPAAKGALADLHKHRTQKMKAQQSQGKGKK